MGNRPESADRRVALAPKALPCDFNCQDSGASASFGLDEFVQIQIAARLSWGSVAIDGSHAMPRILVIEDDPTIGQSLKNALERAGHEVVLCANGEEGFFAVSTSAFDLLLLDVVLPGRSGLEVLAGVRKSNAIIPVLMLSSLDEVSDRVRGLSLRADDYLGKPFALEELLARVDALLRRARPAQETKLKVADLQLDLLTRNATRSGTPLKLTLREFELLAYLMRHAGRVVSKTMLVQDVWGTSDRATPIDNVIDVHVSRLRRKLDAPGRAELLRTIRGVGFCLG